MGHITDDWPAGIVRPLTLKCAFASGRQLLTIIPVLARYQKFSKFLKAFTTFYHAKLRLISLSGKYYAKFFASVARGVWCISGPLAREEGGGCSEERARMQLSV